MQPFVTKKTQCKQTRAGNKGTTKKKNWFVKPQTEYYDNVKFIVLFGGKVFCVVHQVIGGRIFVHKNIMILIGSTVNISDNFPLLKTYFKAFTYNR